MKWKEIPDFAKIASIADTFDAITSNRLHDVARPLDVAVKILLEESWKQFDKDLVDIFAKETINQKSLDKVSRDVDSILRDLNRKFELEETDIV